MVRLVLKRASRVDTRKPTMVSTGEVARGKEKECHCKELNLFKEKIKEILKVQASKFKRGGKAKPTHTLLALQALGHQCKPEPDSLRLLFA